jgi:hypothetical protein
MAPPPSKMQLDFLLTAGPPAPSTQTMFDLSSPTGTSSSHSSPLPSSPLPYASETLSAPTGASAARPSRQDMLSSSASLVTPDARHVCGCGAAFNRSLHYLYHVHNSSAPCDVPSLPLFPCEIPGCHSAFRRKTDRAKHVSCVHARVRPFKCASPGCRSAFFFAKDEKKHYSTVHLRHRPYKCERCGQSFGKKEHLKNHENRTHLHIKPYGCKTCGVMLASKHNLLSHINTRAHARAVAVQGAQGLVGLASAIDGGGPSGGGRSESSME